MITFNQVSFFQYDVYEDALIRKKFIGQIEYDRSEWWFSTDILNEYTMEDLTTIVNKLKELNGDISPQQ